METLFSQINQQKRERCAPLAWRMRPRSLGEVVGQQDICGEGTWLYQAIHNDTLTSLLLYGPPGVGKTSLAHVIAHTTHAQFEALSAIGGTVAELRKIIARADEALLRQGIRTIVFIDEIHRFSRAQQDALLPAVEQGIIILIGATTENPYFEVNTALRSRLHIITMHALSESDVRELLQRACTDKRGLNSAFKLAADACERIVALAHGDARAALTILDEAATLAYVQPNTVQTPPQSGKTLITLQHVEASAGVRLPSYDKNKDEHYDIISAFIKSMRGSDPDAALFWLARMIDGGEDPRFIARRIMIAASEDVGNADPQALLVASAAFRAAEVIGYPECRINLAQAALYVALAPKSNAAEAGIDAALAAVRSSKQAPVPSYLRDRHRPGAQDYGVYHYPHNYEDGWVDQRYLPEGMQQGSFFKPSTRGWEAQACKRLEGITAAHRTQAADQRTQAASQRAQAANQRTQAADHRTQAASQRAQAADYAKPAPPPTPSPLPREQAAHRPKPSPLPRDTR